MAALQRRSPFQPDHRRVRRAGSIRRLGQADSAVAQVLVKASSNEWPRTRETTGVFFHGSTRADLVQVSHSALGAAFRLSPNWQEGPADQERAIAGLLDAAFAPKTIEGTNGVAIRLAIGRLLGYWKSLP